MKQKAIAITKGVIGREPNYVFYWLNFLRGLSYGIISPIYAIFLFNFGLDAFQVSLTNLCFIVSLILFQLPAGALADAWGRKKTFLLSSLFNSLSFFIYAFGKVWLAFILAEVLSALGFVLMTGIIEAWVVDAWKQRSNLKEYGFLFSRADTSANLAGILAGLSGGLLGSISLRLPFFIGGLFFIALFIMSYLLVEESLVPGSIQLGKIIKKSINLAKDGTQESLSNQYIWRVALYAGIAMIGFKAMDMFWSKRFVDLAQGKIWVTGYIWVLATIFMIIGNLLLKWWVDRRKDYLSGFIIISLFGFLSILLSSINTNFYLAVFFFLFYEISRGIHRPALFGYFNKLITCSKRATILSFTIAVAWLGGALGLLTLGWIAKRFSIQTSWLIASGIILLSIIPIFRLHKANL